MQREFLEKLGGLDKDKIEAIIVEHGKSIAAEQEKAKSLKAQLKDVKDKLEALGGVDVNALNAQIESLKTELATKEADYNNKIAERNFNDLLEKNATAYKVRDIRTIKPFLDLDSLKKSKNQERDVENAFKALSEDTEKSYLFNSETNVPRITSVTEGINEGTKTVNAEFNTALRSLFNT